jgi:hypothetical protein
MRLGRFDTTSMAAAKVLAAAVLADAIGLLGAWAFNPDGGAIAGSLVAWRVFGILTYAAAACAWCAVVVILFVGVRGGCRRRHRSRRP